MREQAERIKACRLQAVVILPLQLPLCQPANVFPQSFETSFKPLVVKAFIACTFCTTFVLYDQFVVLNKNCILSWNRFAENTSYDSFVHNKSADLDLFSGGTQEQNT